MTYVLLFAALSALFLWLGSRAERRLQRLRAHGGTGRTRDHQRRLRANREDLRRSRVGRL